MNRNQKIVLVLAVVGLIVVVLVAPHYVMYGNIKSYSVSPINASRAQIDMNWVLIGWIIVAAAGTVGFFILKK